jgi:alkylation response protein AidB-like acyl-CoA dehydrogenase
VSQAINRYKTDLRELNFVLFEQFKLSELLSKEPFASWDDDSVKMVINEVARFGREVTGPLNASGDKQGCRIENGRVITPEGFKDAWKKLYDAGWRTLGSPVEWGGQGAPHALAAIVEEIMSGANAAFNMYPGLTYGAVELLIQCATEDQKKKFVPAMLDGRCGGTMCLTEPHAGSDVGSARTTASRNADGTFSIRGTKIYISAGDHDLSYDDTSCTSCSRASTAPRWAPRGSRSSSCPACGSTTTGRRASTTTSASAPSSTRWASTARRRVC